MAEDFVTIARIAKEEAAAPRKIKRHLQDDGQRVMDGFSAEAPEPARLTDPDSFVITMVVNKTETDMFDTGIPDAWELLRNAALAFSFLEELLERNDSSYGLSNLLGLAARGIRAAEDKEVPALKLIDRKLREAVARKQQQDYLR
ncbi:hypothetical protein [Cereibacter sphaeroides]|uniref:hypothetical protein n=1 Tax=Cereibacter sphaeroides TaxID=1063 RepID=UPI003FCDEEB3